MNINEYLGSVAASQCKLLQVANSLLTCTVELTPVWLASCGYCGPFLPTNQNIGFLALHTALETDQLHLLPLQLPIHCLVLQDGVYNISYKDNTL